MLVSERHLNITDLSLTPGRIASLTLSSQMQHLLLLLFKNLAFIDHVLIPWLPLIDTKENVPNFIGFKAEDLFSLSL
jgi:hypothetical protein